MIEQDYDFACPYCGADNSVNLDMSGGAKQSFIQDCTVCCKPIQISLQFENSKLVDFSAEVQS